MKLLLTIFITLLSLTTFAMGNPNEGVEPGHLILETRNELCPLNFDQHELCAEVEWLDGPYLNRTENKIRIHFFQLDQNDQRVYQTPEGHVMIYPWMVMPNREHGSSPVTQELISEGLYEISEVFMMRMMGHWEIRLKLFDEMAGEIFVSQVGVHIVTE